MARGSSLGILEGRKVYVPRMTYCGASAFAAALRSIGIDAEVTPKSDARTAEYGAKLLAGDECFPAKVTTGDLLKLIEEHAATPQKLAFFMPSANGPCRFGQYETLLRKLLLDLKLGDKVMIFSPESQNGYREIGAYGNEVKRTAWRALLAADILRKLLLKTRPYESNPGDTERVFEECLQDICKAVEVPGIIHKRRMELLLGALLRTRGKFRKIPAKYQRSKQLIGIVGEIFCRLNTYSNLNLVKVLERHGGEAWLADFGEWIWYSDSEMSRRIRLAGRQYSLAMLGVKIKAFVQRSDEHQLYEPFREDFAGYEEPENVEAMLQDSAAYLPRWGAIGEMVMSVSKAKYLYHKGVDGIIDISPFTCMNGITSEAIYPRLSKDCEGIPIRSFYFDGTQTDLDRDIGIFMELAKTYRKKKNVQRRFPMCFFANNA